MLVAPKLGFACLYIIDMINDVVVDPGP